MHLNYRQKDNGLYILTRNDIEEIATGILSEHMPGVLEHPQPVDIMRLAQEEYGLDVQNKFLTFDGSVLGLIAFFDSDVELIGDMFTMQEEHLPEGTIVIERTLLGRDKRPRYRFTVAHETSHWFIHRSYHDPNNRQYQCRTAKKQYIACRSVDIESRGNAHNASDDAWQEWQADSLAAALLMPENAFRWAAHDALRKVGLVQATITKGLIGYSALREIETYLSEQFEVSLQAAEIRMQHLGILKTQKYAS